LGTISFKPIVFLPFIHQAVRYLAVQTGNKTVFASGDLLPLPEGGTLKRSARPGCSCWSNGIAPGFYLRFTKAGAQDFCYASTAAVAEADPATISEDEIVAAIERARGEVLGSIDDGTAGQPSEEAGCRLWWYLMWGVCC